MEDRVVEVAVLARARRATRPSSVRALVERDREGAAVRLERQHVGLRRRRAARSAPRASRRRAASGRRRPRTRRDRRRGRVAGSLAASSPPPQPATNASETSRTSRGAHGLRSYPPMPNVTRCEWAAGGDELMVAYHDEEWGVPSHDDRHLFEMLTLEGAQAGLSWSTILRKREGYRRGVRRLRPGRSSRASRRRTSSACSPTRASSATG